MVSSFVHATGQEVSYAGHPLPPVPLPVELLLETVVPAGTPSRRKKYQTGIKFVFFRLTSHLFVLNSEHSNVTIILLQKFKIYLFIKNRIHLTNNFSKIPDSSKDGEFRVGFQKPEHPEKTHQSEIVCKTHLTCLPPGIEPGPQRCVKPEC